MRGGDELRRLPPLGHAKDRVVEEEREEGGQGVELTLVGRGGGRLSELSFSGRLAGR